MRTTYRTGGKSNPPSCSLTFSPQTLSVLVKFLYFIQLELRTQPSCQTWTPWHRCRPLRGFRRPSSTAAWSLLHSKPRWGCRGRRVTCTAWLLHATALAPLTPTLWPTLLPHSRGTTSSCQWLHHHLMTDTAATNSSIPPPLQLLVTWLPQTQNLTSDFILSTLKILTRYILTVFFSVQLFNLVFRQNIHTHTYCCWHSSSYCSVTLHWAKEICM